MRFQAPDHRGEKRPRATLRRILEADIKLDNRFLPDGPYDWWDVGMFFLVLGVSGVVATVFGQTLAANLLGAGIAIGFALVYRSIARFLRTKHAAQNLADGLLSIERCPSCLYQLSNLTVHPDGCTQCPECDAAWRLPEHTFPDH